MENEEIIKKLNELEIKIDATYKSAEKTRKYILWYVIGTAITIVLPIIGLIIIIPWFLNVMSQAYKGLL